MIQFLSMVPIVGMHHIKAQKAELKLLLDLKREYTMELTRLDSWGSKK